MGETTSYSGKLREAFLAIKIAQAQDKSQVLCNYMNTIYLGRGAYGIQAAAKAYFNKNASDLTLSEAAMLAGIIPRRAHGIRPSIRNRPKSDTTACSAS